MGRKKIPYFCKGFEGVSCGETDSEKFNKPYKTICRKCRKKYCKKYRKNNKEKTKLYDANRNSKEDRKLELSSHGKVARSVKSGKLIKSKSCQNPLRKKEHDFYFRLEPHHEDHSKKLEIIWLCQSCHRIRDNEIKKGLNTMLVAIQQEQGRLN